MNEENQHPDQWTHEPPAAAEPTFALQPQPQPDTPPPVKRESVTPEQAKVDAIANLTMTAYARASELKLTPEEIAGLQKEFPDEAFKPGAAGKESLIYVEHAYLRDRLNEVLGVGQWSIVPRKRWGEDFTIQKRNEPDVQACRIYVEAMLLIRGCFVAEAVGDMTYYKNNQSQNYGDAVEGAKTAAFRRCAKELGVGLQAWKKDWCAGWWQRKNASGRAGGSQSPPPTRPAAPAPQSAPRPPATASQVLPQEATEDQRARFIALFPGDSARIAEQFFWDKGWIIRGEPLTTLPLKYVPTTKKTADDLVAQVEAFSTRPPAGAEETWRKYPMPWGKNKDIPLAELEKNYLYGLVMNYEPEPNDSNGNPKKPEWIAKDEEFRRLLDDCGRHYGWIKEAK